MSEIINPNEPLYEGGSMTAGEFIAAEIEINEKMPDYSMGEIPVVKLRFGQMELGCHYLNTEIVRYTDEWEKFSHIKVETDRQPVYFFRDTGTVEDEEERWVKIANHLLERDFPMVLPEFKPRPLVLDLYWQGIRGSEPIEEVIGRLLLEGK